MFKAISVTRYLSKAIHRLCAESEGATAVEYAVMIALIIVVCIGAVTSMSTSARNSFDKSAAAIGGVL